MGWFDTVVVADDLDTMTLNERIAYVCGGVKDLVVSSFREMREKMDEVVVTMIPRFNFPSNVYMDPECPNRYYVSVNLAPFPLVPMRAVEAFVQEKNEETEDGVEFVLIQNEDELELRLYITVNVYDVNNFHTITDNDECACDCDCDAKAKAKAKCDVEGDGDTADAADVADDDIVTVTMKLDL